MKLPINYDATPQRLRKLAREQYVQEQNNNCQSCGKSLFGKPTAEVMSKPINHRLFPASMFNYPVHLHHDRKTGLTIGAVHARCNAYLWQYKGE